ncbi:MAG: hypothetical protein JKY80_08960 [Mariprofundaceae bacterium]|nr:hypothetical protein [Mariprofundaceae bacterium]
MNRKATTYTVATLIEALKAFPQDTPIVVSGYESGYENTMPLKLIKLEQNKENKYWDGEFQEITEESEHTLDVVVLSRVVRDE